MNLSIGDFWKEQDFVYEIVSKENEYEYEISETGKSNKKNPSTFIMNKKDLVERIKKYHEQFESILDPSVDYELE
jgi:tRNA U34 5-carboxymethylaminomethyl modifying GTPase MnmE/TrmE